MNQHGEARAEEPSAPDAPGHRASPGLKRPLIMGILNLTPDSFSDGGRFTDTPPETPSAAAAPQRQDPVASAHTMLAQGADLIDIGGESTRPGADPVSPEEEQRRILPVLQTLLAAQVPVSVDTRHAATAQAACDLAANRAAPLIINDVSGLLTDPDMPEVVAASGAQIVITHNRGDARTMQQRTHYVDLLDEVTTELRQVRERYVEAGVVVDNIILDPGIGFAKTHAQNWELIRHLEHFTQLGHRVLFGASRKGFLTAQLGHNPSMDQRDAATAVLSARAALAGCWAVRVHHVPVNHAAVSTAGVAW